MESGGSRELWSEMPPSITTRFIVLNEGRSGSTLLVDELDRRWTEIRAQREVFHPMRREGRRWFEDVVYQTFFVETGEPIVGCKIHGVQITEDQLEALVSLEGMKVIILRRRDLLRRFVSERIANRTDQWMQTRGDGGSEPLPPEVRRITVDIPSFRDSMAISTRWFAECERISAVVPTLDVWYEDLTVDLDGELRRIAGFLGAGEPEHEAPPLLLRQNPEPLSTLVENYGEVRAFLDEIGLGDTLSDEYAPVAASEVERDGISDLSCWPTRIQQVLLRVALAPAEDLEARWATWMAWRDSKLEPVGLTVIFPAVHHQLRGSTSVMADSNDYRVESLRTTALKIRLLEALQSTTEGLSSRGLDLILLGQTALLAMNTRRDGAGFRILTMTGLDLTTDREQLDRVAAALAEMGWAVSSAQDASDPDAVDDHMVLHRDDLELRLHRAITTGSVHSEALDRDLRTDLRRAEHLGPNTRLPAAGDLLISIILDGLLSRPAGSVAWILDAHDLMHNHLDDRDWNRVIDLTGSLGLGAPVGVAMHLLDDLCENLIPRDILEQLDLIPVSEQQRAAFDEAMRTP